MGKATKLYVLMGVFLAICAAAFAASHYQQKKEHIKTSGEVILEIPADSVTALSWTNETGTFSFTKNEEWTYDDDAAFPVSADKIRELLSQFEALSAAFAIDEVTDYAQYGLDEPICTVSVTAGGESYTIKLGDFSKMDGQRYISIGDDKVYLAVHDPLEEFDAVLRDMIRNDSIPEFDTAEQITFTGEENYTILREEDRKSLCEDDVFFTEGKPLDTDSVDALVSGIQSLNLSSYVSYHVSQEELAAFGLLEPDLTIRLTYGTRDTDGNVTDTGELLLETSRNPQEAAAYDAAVEAEAEELPEVTHYVRVGQSQIVYEISESAYYRLTQVSYDTLRHQTLFTADFDTVTAIDVALNGENCTFTYTPPEDQAEADAEGTWTYGEEEFNIYRLKTAFCAISASAFTEQTPSGREEISLTVHLDNADFPTFTLALYRLDGTDCIACVDGKPTALVSRSKTVDLIEAVNELILAA